MRRCSRALWEVVAGWERRVVDDPLADPGGERQRQHLGDVAGHVDEVGVAEAHPDGQHVLDRCDEPVDAEKPLQEPERLVPTQDIQNLQRSQGRNHCCHSEPTSWIPRSI